MTGVVEGGWGFVVAAYVLSACVLGGYAASVLLRYRNEKGRAATEARRETKA